MINNKSIFVLLLFLSLYLSKSQAQSPIVLYELIQEDRVTLFLTKDFLFTEDDCYDYTRQIRINGNGDFHGYFEDRSITGRLLAKGAYHNGLKHGYFEVFHTNGNVFSKGYYTNDKPVGTWEYFYRSGLHERILTFTDSTVLLMRFVDENGKVKVNNGHGIFKGVVAGSVKFRNENMFKNIYSNIRAIGKVVNGQPEGKWIMPDHRQQVYYIEKFHHGRMTKNTLDSKRKTSLNPRSMLNTFFLDNYLSVLELFEIEDCTESQQYFFNRYPSDFKAFGQDLRQRVDYMIETDLRSARKDYYQTGNNILTVQFSVNDQGKAYDIKLVSAWGEHLLKVIENTINKTVFSTYSETTYFHLKLSYAGGYRYKYNFRFTKRDPVH